MRTYTGLRPGFTPTTPVLGACLEGQANKVARVKELLWSGGATVSSAVRSRFSRDTAVGTGARTAIEIGKPNSDADSSLFLSSAYATAAPTNDTKVLFGGDWNAHGGVLRWTAKPNEGFHVIGATSASMYQVIGDYVQSAWIAWDELG